MVKPTRTGVILESIDEKKTKLVANVNTRVSLLDEISIYTTDSDGSAPLIDVFTKIKEEFGDDPGIDSQSSGEELKSFIKFILPQYDEERVYTSDVKKLVSWYKILHANFPELLTKEEGEKNDEQAGDTQQEESNGEEKDN